MHCCPEPKFETMFHERSFFVKLWGFEGCLFGQFGTINARYITRDVSGDLSGLRNCTKLVEGSLFVIIDLLLGAKFITLYFIWRVGR